MKLPQKKNFKGVYCLKCDIQKYFASIDHKILLTLLAKKIKDEKILALVKKIIDSTFDKIEQETLFEKRKTGIPIGNLTSQLFANVYLNELDQFVKHQNFGQKTFSSQKYYIRYMDDFLFLGKDKKELLKIKEEVADFLDKNLRLKLHPKKATIFPIKNGIDFLGYRVFHPRPVKLRKGTVYRFLKRMKKYQKVGITPETMSLSVQSFLGFAGHADSGGLIRKLQIRDHLI